MSQSVYTEHPLETPKNNRLGFHYFPDTLHYREKDLQTWLPELKALGAGWVTLVAPCERAIPEQFLRGMSDGGVQPILHFQMDVEAPVDGDVLGLLFSAYARWGVQYIILYDRPNSKRRWTTAAWAQADLVERFLDIYLPLAELAVGEGLTPVFPPLEPGGDYWDLAFLETALGSLERRGCRNMIEALALGAYAGVGDQPLHWGAGGPGRWPGARPYVSAPGIQDHKGFRIFEWYQEVAAEQIGKRLPVLLLQAGSQLEETQDLAQRMANKAIHAQRNLALVQWAVGSASAEAEVQFAEPLPAEVIACNFWLLSADKEDANIRQSWFQPDGLSLPVVDAVRRWTADRAKQQQAEQTAGTVERRTEADKDRPNVQENAPAGEGTADTEPLVPRGRRPDEHPIEHYLLLPLYAWGVAEWSLDLIQPLLQRSHPTIGFSLEEARLAQRITVVGGPGSISDEALLPLRQAGCFVERLLEDGTLLAT